MEKDEIHFGDIKRWLFGDAPPEFMIEVFIRTILIYLFLLLIVRLMGKRMSGQITLTEMAVMITLGAIVSPAIQLSWCKKQQIGRCNPGNLKPVSKRWRTEFKRIGKSTRN